MEKINYDDTFELLEQVINLYEQKYEVLKRDVLEAIHKGNKTEATKLKEEYDNCTDTIIKLLMYRKSLIRSELKEIQVIKAQLLELMLSEQDNENNFNLN